MENTKYGKRREGRWTPIRVKAQDTRANPNSWEIHLVRKRWDIGLLRALSLWIMMMMMTGIIMAGIPQGHTHTSPHPDYRGLVDANEAQITLPKWDK